MKKQFVIVYNAKVESSTFPMYLKDPNLMEFAHGPTLALQFDTEKDAGEMIAHCIENGFLSEKNAKTLIISEVEV